MKKLVLLSLWAESSAISSSVCVCGRVVRDPLFAAAVSCFEDKYKADKQEFIECSSSSLFN